VNDDLEEALARLRAISTFDRSRRAGRLDRQAEALARRCRPGQVDLAPWSA